MAEAHEAFRAIADRDSLSRKERRKAENVEKTIAAIRAEPGARRVAIVDPAAGCWRIYTRDRVIIDFWVGTERWRQVGRDIAHRASGDGLIPLLEHLRSR